MWIRNGLKTRHERLLRLEETVRKRKITLTEEQIQALALRSRVPRAPHRSPCHGRACGGGHLLHGHPQGRRQGLHPDRARLLQPPRLGPALHLEDAGDRVQILYNHVLPCFEKPDVQVGTILSDNRREYCGRPDKHLYEPSLQLQDIEHRTTKVGRPQSNGLIERFQPPFLEVHLRDKGTDDLVRDRRGDAEGPDVYLEIYNQRRPQQGRGMKGLMPSAVFKARPGSAPATSRPGRHG